jgi:hypothetical protein
MDCRSGVRENRRVEGRRGGRLRERSKTRRDGRGRGGCEEGSKTRRDGGRRGKCEERRRRVRDDKRGLGGRGEGDAFEGGFEDEGEWRTLDRSNVAARYHFVVGEEEEIRAGSVGVVAEADTEFSFRDLFDSEVW